LTLDEMIVAPGTLLLYLNHDVTYNYVMLQSSVLAPNICVDVRLLERLNVICVII